MQPNPCLNKNYTSCIFYTGVTYTTAEDGIQVCLGESLNTTLETIIDRLLSLNEQCTVKVSSTDECCGYLGEKLVSETVGTLDITTVTNEETDCQTLNIEIPTPEWELITFGTAMANQGSRTSKLTVDALGFVQLIGRVTASNYPTSTLITTLGTAYRPVDTQNFPVNVNNGGTYVPGEIQILSTGAVSLLVNTLSGVSCSFSLENCRYYKSTV